ncbi:glycoside hydrolase family 172 protein [Amycolatopsis sp.]|uniref:glycoside hydrolase family 172 protein n=1 Tax=Amycolatopsis sp. TaxID=37632 RepID=UPI002C3C1B08|nr:glycoside hydrolase family 172 protein [Amycolatopsis sp.]HVV07908.1 glycoside hydrolase family 172 protein [Amycolatopsis sp.]
MTEIWRLRDGVTRSISAENFTGAKGAGGMATEGTGAWAARELGQGWKVSPSILLPDGRTATLADIAGPGIVEHIWLTTDRGRLRDLTLRMYWDDEENPSVDTPLGDFFCNGCGELALVDSDMIVVAPAGGLNSYWPLPFRGRARITLENHSGADVPVYYQVTYRLRDVPADAAYLHAAWRRANPLGNPAVHTILDGVRGRGSYVGTYLTIQPNAPGWWGEGEIKFYLDGDGEFPTICGTGTEDYFGGAWNFDLGGRYGTCNTRYTGLAQVLPANQIYQPGQRFGLYRWHLRDAISFAGDLRVTIQALGWQDDGRYLPLVHADVSSTAFWYQARD